MKRVFAAVLAVACVIGTTPGLARGAGFVHASGRAGFVHNHTTLFGALARHMPRFENRIPAPLPPPPPSSNSCLSSQGTWRMC
jgi:hypothetical protein